MALSTPESPVRLRAFAHVGLLSYVLKGEAIL